MSVHPPITAVREAVSRALAEDLEPLGDITTALIPEREAVASFVARTEGVIAGRRCVEETFRQIDPHVGVEWIVDDGAEVEADTVISLLHGSLASILTGERTALNFLCHLSGVATLTRRYVRATHGNAQVWDTRKTTPGLRALEKAAVRAGGGRNHRGNLSEWVLLKDNHLAGVGITDAVRRARDTWPARTIQVEADTLEQVTEAIEAGADIILLDNMTPQDVTDAVKLRGAADRPLLEVSGGVNLQTIGDYSSTGVDLISVGSITHSARVLDVGLDIVEVRG